MSTQPSPEILTIPALLSCEKLVAWCEENSFVHLANKLQTFKMDGNGLEDALNNAALTNALFPPPCEVQEARALFSRFDLSQVQLIAQTCDGPISLAEYARFRGIDIETLPEEQQTRRALLYLILQKKLLAPDSNQSRQLCIEQLGSTQTDFKYTATLLQTSLTQLGECFDDWPETQRMSFMRDADVDIESIKHGLDELGNNTSIVALGGTSAGKSSFWNCLLSEQYLPVTVGKGSSSIVEMSFSDQYSLSQGELSTLPGNLSPQLSLTWTPVNCNSVQELQNLLIEYGSTQSSKATLNKKTLYVLRAEFPSEVLKCGMTLIDCPGLDDLGAQQKARAFVHNYLLRTLGFVLIIRADGASGLIESIQNLLRAVLEKEVEEKMEPISLLDRLFFIVTHLDLHKSEAERDAQCSRIEQEVREALSEILTDPQQKAAVKSAPLKLHRANFKMYLHGLTDTCDFPSIHPDWVKLHAEMIEFFRRSYEFRLQRVSKHFMFAIDQYLRTVLSIRTRVNQTVEESAIRQEEFNQLRTAFELVRETLIQRLEVRCAEQRKNILEAARAAALEQIAELSNEQFQMQADRIVAEKLSWAQREFNSLLLQGLQDELSSSPNLLKAAQQLNSWVLQKIGEDIRSQYPEVQVVSDADDDRLLTALGVGLAAVFISVSGVASLPFLLGSGFFLTAGFLTTLLAPKLMQFVSDRRRFQVHTASLFDRLIACAVSDNEIEEGFSIRFRLEALLALLTREAVANIQAEEIEILDPQEWKNRLESLYPRLIAIQNSLLPTSWTDPQIPPQELQVNRQILLGRGGNAAVYSGQIGGLSVAVKVLTLHRSSLSSRQIFQIENEARLLRQSKHPNVVTCHGLCTQAEEVLLVMDLLATTLKQRITNDPRPSMDDIKHWAIQILLGLQFLHDGMHIAHRDLNSSNIMFSSDGQIKLVDFGTAKEIWKASTTPTTSIRYAAPELFEGTIYSPQQADIFSLGLILFELFSWTIIETRPPKVDGKLQLSLSSIGNQHLQDLISRATDLTPRLRPSASEMLGIILQPLAADPSIVQTKKRKLRALFLDGGGTRGIITCAILAELEKRVQKPCWEIFDLIGGTSTGAIIGAWLATGRSAVSALEMYKQLASKVFSNPSALRLVRRGGRYDPQCLEQQLETAFGEKLMSHADFKTHFFAVCRKDSTPGPFLLRNYVPKFCPSAQPGEAGWPVVSALRASSAAGSYFPPLQKSGHLYSDGGVGFNNPADLGLYELASLLEVNPLTTLSWVDFMVSVGTGSTCRLKLSNPFQRKQHPFLQLKDTILDQVTDSQQTHLIVAREFSAQNQTSRYFRFNPELDREIDLAASSPEELDQMEAATQSFIDSSSQAFETLERHVCGHLLPAASPVTSSASSSSASSSSASSSSASS